MKSKKFLFGIVVVLLLVTSVLPGCNNEPPVEADELVIPSSLTPDRVFIEIANAGPQINTWPFFQGKWSAKYIEPYAMPQGATEEQFIEGYGAGIPEFLYIKRGGKRAGYGLFKLVLCISVLKYEDTESAERSFTNISETQELRDSTYGGITLKSAIRSLPWWEDTKMWDESTVPYYLIQSNCFIIYLYGREDVAKDILDRIIVAFGV
jgi:hypothetical protein